MGQGGADWEMGGGRGSPIPGMGTGYRVPGAGTSATPLWPPAPTVGCGLVLNLKVQKSLCGAGPWQVFGV